MHISNRHLTSALYHRAWYFVTAALAALMITGFTAGCSKDSSPLSPAQVQIDEDREEIQGEWLWDYSFGGIAGMRITPESSGQTRRLTFGDRQLAQFVNDTLRQTDEYELALDVAIFSTDSVPVVLLDGEVRFVYEFHRPDSLILHDNFVDGFANHYHRD